jgi:DNA repair photolyase
VLSELTKKTGATVFISIPFDTDALGRAIEPYASAVSKRFEALEALSSAGVRTGVGIAPIIPGLNDDAIVRVLRRAHEAGASRAFMTLLRLPGHVKDVFEARIEEACPQRVGKIRNAILEMRKGKMNESKFGDRMHGQGARWEALEATFRAHVARLGLNRSDEDAPAHPRAPRNSQPNRDPATAGRPRRQLELWSGD